MEMKQFTIFVVAVLVLIGNVQAFPADSDGEDASIRKMINGEKTGISSLDEPDRIRFYLYTQANSSESFEIDMNDVETLVRSPFDSRVPTTFVIHGWKDKYYGGPSVIRKALLELSNRKSPNVILVDWNVYSGFENYTVSHEFCPSAGKIIAQFIDWMHENAKLPFDTLILIGHSMGSQVAGFVGKNVKRGKIHSIIGMDPALPLFPYSSPKDRLAATDAEYVETIHTNGGQWGFYEPIGQTAFYPNGGKYQPGCGVDLDGMCSHQRAVVYLAEALSEENRFHAIKCDELNQVEEGKCDQFESIIRMGDPSNILKTRGIFYLETNSEPPYARGTMGILRKKQGIKKHVLS